MEEKIITDAKTQMNEILDHIDSLHDNGWNVQGSLWKKLIDLESILNGDLEFEED